MIGGIIGAVILFAVVFVWAILDEYVREDIVFAAALALQGLDGFEARFQDAMDRAKLLFHQLNKLPGLQVSEFKYGSNIFPMNLDDSVDSSRFIEVLRGRDIHVYPEEGSSTLSSLTVNATILRQPADAILSAFRDALAVR